MKNGVSSAVPRKWAWPQALYVRQGYVGCDQLGRTFASLNGSLASGGIIDLTRKKNIYPDTWNEKYNEFFAYVRRW